MKKALREEVSYRCPMCGSPYLTYHHFDPPWEVRKHHNPKGMIALCAKHHDQANQGKYTEDQLRGYKSGNSTNPRLGGFDFGWLQNTLLVVSGGYYLDPRIYLQLQGRKIVWFNRDENNNLLLNMDIRTESNEPIILMCDNDWIERDPIAQIDEEFLPGGHHLTIRRNRPAKKQRR